MMLVIYKDLLRYFVSNTLTLSLISRSKPFIDAYIRMKSGSRRTGRRRRGRRRRKRRRRRRKMR